MKAARKVLQTEDIIKVGTQDTLASVLNKLSSSHDAAFVFGDKGDYMGLINPYYCVIRTSSPSNAKVNHCLYHSPRIKTSFPLAKIAQLMIESKVHYLPVFDEQDKFIGIVTARKILAALEYLDIYTLKIADFVKRKKTALVTVFEDDSIANALQIFKSSRVSKLVVISKDMKLRGILSYYDLISYLAMPKRRERTVHDGNKASLHDKSVRNFMKTYVLTLETNDYVRDALHLILEKKIGSVVIVDGQRHPISIITTRDLLGLMVKESGKKKIELTTSNLSRENRRVLGGFFEQFSRWIQKKPDMDKAKIIVKEERKGLFEVVLSLFPLKGKPKVIKREGKNLEKVLHEVKNKEE